MTRITVNKHVLEANRHNGRNDPAVLVELNYATPQVFPISCHNVEVKGPCRVVSTDPDDSCCGSVWIETESEVTTA